MSPRRRPPRRIEGFISAWSSRDVHATALRLNTLRRSQDLSEQQEWLFDVLVRELAWRRKEALARNVWGACMCELCVGPFDDHQGDRES